MIIAILLAILALVLYFRFFKIPKYGNMVLVTGGLKTGKTLLSVNMAVRKYRSQLFMWKLRRAFIRIDKKLFRWSKPKIVPEMPLFYSNVPVKVKNFVLLDKDLLLRNKRFAFGSVCYICEASLVADSMTFKDKDINENLLLLNKLFAHETHGGYLFYDTQSLFDCHYAVKRCLSSYFYIHHNRKIPFFVLLWVREMYNTGSDQVVESGNDVEENLRLIIVPKKYWTLYDRYAFSSLTDSLPVKNDILIPNSMKVDKIVSFKEGKNYEKK